MFLSDIKKTHSSNGNFKTQNPGSGRVPDPSLVLTYNCTMQLSMLFWCIGHYKSCWFSWIVTNYPDWYVTTR